MTTKYNRKQYNTAVITPNGITAAEIASATLRKLICQPPQARVVAQIKNMAAFVTSKK